MGVCLYTLIFGTPPFQTSSQKETFSKILGVEYSFPKNIKIRSECIELIDNILKLFPSDRLSLKEMKNSKFLSL
jgi:serine/threonine protein kinase